MGRLMITPPRDGDTPRSLSSLPPPLVLRVLKTCLCFPGKLFSLDDLLNLYAGYYLSLCQSHFTFTLCPVRSVQCTYTNKY